jgi:murein L,D-transpeptidase YcbB/YkuD
VKYEIAPAMKSDPGYLKKHNMEIVKQNDSLPEIRQLPGKDNALGKVKFLFPNTFDIYMHDSPDKTLFKKQDRALSHGCIRVADAAKMAEYLLRDQPEWNAQKINQAMNSGKEQSVSVKKSVPVYITYYTAWMDEKGKMNFRNDVYGHDKDAAQKMCAARS